jgi:hypothetical protein
VVVLRGDLQDLKRSNRSEAGGTGSDGDEEKCAWADDAAHGEAGVGCRGGGTGVN